jgi:hypothetical protein
MRNDVSAPVKHLQHALDSLRSKLMPLASNPERVAQWLDDIEPTDTGKLLALCLSMDLHTGLVSVANCTEILERLPATRSGKASRDLVEARRSYEREHPPQMRCLNADACWDDDAYKHGFVRVMEIERFARFYDSPRSGRGLSSEEIAEVREEYFGPGSEEDFADITAVWTGRNDRSWILPLPQYREMVEQALESEGDSEGTGLADMFLDSLGLSMPDGRGRANGGPDLVAVIYAPGCRTLECRQPTALDATWEEEEVFFVSYGRLDGWGRTHSLYGQREGRRERIHGPFAPLTSAFRGEYIGEATKPTLSMEHVLKEVARRYQEFVLAKERSTR